MVKKAEFLKGSRYEQIKATHDGRITCCSSFVYHASSSFGSLSFTPTSHLPIPFT